MRVPVSWLNEYVQLPADLSPRELASALIAVGLEVETVTEVGAGLQGPLVVARVADVTELTDFKKPIRLCHVEVGEVHGGVRTIICGARNFQAGDLVVAALPGAVLPGGFAITSRKTYGHISDGMLCSAAELGLEGDASGIIVLSADTNAQLGDDAGPLLGLGEAVLDIAVTPDRGYCLAMRGVAREAGIALTVEFTDPAMAVPDYPPASPVGPAVRIEDQQGCPRYSAVLIEGLNPNAPTPRWLAQRLSAAGMRPISLAVDVTNYVMLELGQPLHAFDADKVVGTIEIRRARTEETLVTLDGVKRILTPEDLVIADDSGVIGLAGTMGGESTEISVTTTRVVLEAASFAATAVAGMARRHKIPSEASRRFERGVDPELPLIASARAAQLLVEHGGGVIVSGTLVGEAAPATVLSLPLQLPADIAGAEISPDFVISALRRIGADIDIEGEVAQVTSPSWRPDLRYRADLVEEVIRLFGYDNVPDTLPSPPAGHGLTSSQRARRAMSRALAATGLTETLSYPFVSKVELANLGITDDRANMLQLANPLSEEQSFLRTTLLPGLVAVAKRNLARGADGVSLYEMGLVFLNSAAATQAASPPVTQRPSDAQLAAIDAALPRQPLHVAALFAGQQTETGVWGPGRNAAWSDGVDVARTIAATLGMSIEVQQATDQWPYHPGRCAAISINSIAVGFAGELHPRVTAATGLPARSSALELNVQPLLECGLSEVKAPLVSGFPVVKEDIALIVSDEYSTAEVMAAVASGAGELLESIRCFDEYRGSQIPAGHRSLAFAMRFRAPDRTLSDAEVAAARAAGVAEAANRFAAVLRDGI